MDQQQQIDPLLLVTKKGLFNRQQPTKGAGSFDQQAILRSLLNNRPMMIGGSNSQLPPNSQQLLQQMQGLHSQGNMFNDGINIHRTPMNVSPPANQPTNIQSILDALSLPKNKSDQQKFMEAWIQQQQDK